MKVKTIEVHTNPYELTDRQSMVLL